MGTCDPFQRSFKLNATQSPIKLSVSLASPCRAPRTVLATRGTRKETEAGPCWPEGSTICCAKGTEPGVRTLGHGRCSHRDVRLQVWGLHAWRCYKGFLGRVLVGFRAPQSSFVWPKSMGIKHIRWGCLWRDWVGLSYIHSHMFLSQIP